MRLLAAALLLALSTGLRAPSGDLAVTLEAHPVARSCAVVSTGTIVAYDAGAAHAVSYRFVRSDRTVSPTGQVWVGGAGSVAQSVSDVWTPKGTTPWVAFETLSPERVRSTRTFVAARCSHTAIAAVH